MTKIVSVLYFLTLKVFSVTNGYDELFIPKLKKKGWLDNIPIKGHLTDYTVCLIYMQHKRILHFHMR